MLLKLPILRIIIYFIKTLMLIISFKKSSKSAEELVYYEQ